MTHACTIVAGNYLSRAAVLADSYFDHHPDGAFTVLVVDDEDRRLDVAAHDARVDWRRLGDIGLDVAEIHRLAGCYDVTELSTAVKPLLLRRLMDEGRSEVLYLDPDIYIYDSLAPVFALAARHGIVLTPHTTVPFPDDGRQIDALFVLAAGVYNLGFIAVGTAARPFLDWWWRQTRRHALNDVTRMLFTDQRWVDYVPSLFDHHILKDPGYNVAYWNLHARTVSIDADGRYIVSHPDAAAPVPLRFFHFSGFDPREPWLLSRHQGERPRVLLSEHPVLEQLCRAYVARLAADGPEADDTPDAYGWHACAAGFPMVGRVRRVYWRGVMDAEQGLAPEPPDPFDRAHPERFVDWLNAPDGRSSRRWSRLLAAIYHGRAELRTHFHDLDGADAPRYADWLWHHGVAEERIPLALLPPRDGDLTPHAAPAPAPAAAAGAPATSAASTGPAITISGYFRSGFGIGEAARLLVRATEATGLPHATFTHEVPFSPPIHAFTDRVSDATTFDINLLCVNADQTPAVRRQAGPAFFEGRYTIGYWFWEAAPLPASMRDAFDGVDEVWAATDHVAEILRAVGRRPVFTVPLPLPAPSAASARPPAEARARLGLPDRFTFLQIFDFLSVSPRKNPLGLIEAFRRAFAPDAGPVLVLKSIGGAMRVAELEQLRLAIAGRPDIVLIDAHFTHEEMQALLSSCDCYVSLHRAEGLGLTMAEAMALGKPVIATGYSGNRHFMSDENSYLVDYTLAAIPSGCQPYVTSGRWAEPDLSHAARLMRTVYEQPAAAAAKAARARADLRDLHGVDASAAAIARRVEAIRQMRARPETPAVAVDASTPLAPPVSRAVSTHVEPDKRAWEAADVPLPTASAPAALPALTTAIATLEALVPQLDPLSTPRLSEDHRRFSGLRRLTQRLLFRLIQPYAFQQRQYQDALVQTLMTTVRQLATDVAALQAAAVARQEQGDALAEARAVARQARTDARLEQLRAGAARGETASSEALASLCDRIDRLALAIEGQRFVSSASDGVRRLEYRRATLPAAAIDSYGRSGLDDGVHHADTVHTGNGAHGLLANTRAAVVSVAPEPLFQTRGRLYLPLLADRTPVLDIGCGRGAMLDLLRAAKLPSFGIDRDPRMVTHCRANGHLVEQADAVSFLRARNGAAGPLGAIFSAELPDADDADAFLELLRLCRARLQPDGLLIGESTLTEGEARLQPEALLVLCQRAGFDAARILFHTDPRSAAEAAAEAEAALSTRADRELPPRLSGRFALIATPGRR